MQDKQLVERLLKSDLTQTENVRYLFDMGRNMKDLDIVRKARDAAYRCAYASAPGGLQLVKEILFWLGPYDFDAYLQALEWERKPEERFYLPRRKQLQPIVRALQDLADDKLDELFVSQPPRTGKTTLMLFFTLWIMGRNSELSNLYCSYSDVLTTAFYNGILEVLNDPLTYAWRDIFSNCVLKQTNSKDETIDINRKKRFHSLTCRSLYGTLNGACDATGILISDDLLSGIEEALSKDRLTTVWGKVDNNMLTRGKLDQGCKLLWCGTRWSIGDPIGIRLRTLEGNPRFASWRYRVVNIPALNEKGESNFDYLYGVGFSTESYLQRQASFERNDDMASWLAQYMGEPIEREGAVFSPGGLRYYNGVLPDEEPVRVFMAVDPAWGGGDYTASPVVVKYENGDLYVVDVVFDNREKTSTQPEIVRLIDRYNVQAVQIEATKMTESYVDDINRMLKEKGMRVNLTSRPAPQTLGGKAQRIYDKAPDIRERMVFREAGQRSRAYELFMQNVFSFKIIGKNKHDDAPDSLAMAVTMDAETGYRPHIGDRLF